MRCERDVWRQRPPTSLVITTDNIAIPGPGQTTRRALKGGRGHHIIGAADGQHGIRQGLTDSGRAASRVPHPRARRKIAK
jgi:hypothetical protein